MLKIGACAAWEIRCILALDVGRAPNLFPTVYKAHLLNTN
jgi:hypothetical protein